MTTALRHVDDPAISDTGPGPSMPAPKRAGLAVRATEHDGASPPGSPRRWRDRRTQRADHLATMPEAAASTRPGSPWRRASQWPRFASAGRTAGWRLRGSRRWPPHRSVSGPASRAVGARAPRAATRPERAAGASAAWARCGTRPAGARSGDATPWRRTSAHRVGLGGRPVVAVDQARRDRPMRGVKEDDGRALPGQSDRQDSSPWPEAHDELAQRRQTGRPPPQGVLFGPAGSWRIGGVAPPHLEPPPAIEIERDGPRAGRPDIQRDQDVAPGRVVGVRWTTPAPGGRHPDRHPRTSWWAATLSRSSVTSAPFRAPVA